MDQLEYELRQREDFKVVDWRRETLAKLGAADETAIALAEAGADVHEFEELVKGGCDPELAAEILR